jgi:hypothetical protein
MTTDTDIQNKETDIENFEVSLTKSGFSVKASKISQTGVLEVMKSLRKTAVMILVSIILSITLLHSVGVDFGKDLKANISNIFKAHQRAP